jgi:hypothetical protein
MSSRLGRDEMLRHTEAWVAAWNRRDIDAVLAGFSEAAEFRSPRARRHRQPVREGQGGTDALLAGRVCGAGRAAFHATVGDL